MPLVSWGGSLRSSSESDPGSFQITAFVLGLRMCEILYISIKSRYSLSCSTLALLNTSPDAFQSQTFWGVFFLVQDPLAWKPTVGPQILTSGENFHNFNFSLPCGSVLQRFRSGLYQELALIPISLLFLRYIFSCGKSFLLVFTSFMLIVVL